jgi:hypothetical protein
LVWYWKSCYFLSFSWVNVKTIPSLLLQLW